MEDPSMPIRIHKVLTIAFGFIGCLLVATDAVSDEFPSKPITMIVASTPGGSLDTIGRAYGKQVAKILGQPVVDDYRPGAAGKIAVQAMLRAPRDGYTFAHVATTSLTINPLVDDALGYDHLVDLLPLSMAVRAPAVIAVHPSVPVRTFPELVAYIKSKPGKVFYGSAGLMTGSNLAMEELLMKLGLEVTHVPYKGESAAMTAFIGGQFDLYAGFGVLKPYVDAGRAVAIATSGQERMQQFPNIPTYRESGIPALKDYSYAAWTGFVAPSGIPTAIAAKLEEALIAASRTPEVRSELERQGYIVAGSTGPQMAQAIRSGLDQNRALFSSGRIKLQ